MEHLRHLIVNEVGLTEEHFTAFAGRGKVVQLAKKEFLLKEGATCAFMGFVGEGVLRSFIRKQDNEAIVDFYLKGSFVSAYTSFMTQTPSRGAIQALTEVEVFLISRTDYHDLLAGDAAWYRFGKYIADSLFIRKCRRESSLLVDSAAERYALLRQAYPQLEQLVSQYHIAAYLGIKPESLSRMKSLTYIKK